jgi:HPt (histidine-containing phosphotransfer) domain-containing protein
LSRAAHKLKGASDNLHIEKLAKLALDLETRARQSEKNDWHPEIRTIATEFKLVATELRSYTNTLRKAG